MAHLVLVIFLSLYSFMMNSVACPDGSTMRGYLLNLFIMMAFSVHRSSVGRAFACHLRRSSAFERYCVCVCVCVRGEWRRKTK